MKRLYLILFFLPALGWGQIIFYSAPATTTLPATVPTVYDSLKMSNATDVTFTDYIDVPTNSGVFAYISTYKASTGENSVARSIDGTAMTEIYRFTTGEDRFELWYAKGITAGSNKVMSVTKANGTSEYCVSVISVSDVNQTSAIGSEVHNSGYSDDPTATSSSSAVNELVIQGMRYYNVTMTAASGESIRCNNVQGSTMSSVGIVSKAGETTTVIDPTVSAETGYHRIAIPIKPL